MELAFFGLTPEYRGFIFSQIHEIVYHGNGGYTWSDVYDMPIWLRRFTFNKIKTFIEERSQEPDPAPSPKQSMGPNIAPSYKTKASNI